MLQLWCVVVYVAIIVLRLRCCYVGVCFAVVSVCWFVVLFSSGFGVLLFCCFPMLLFWLSCCVAGLSCYSVADLVYDMLPCCCFAAL